MLLPLTSGAILGTHASKASCWLILVTTLTAASTIPAVTIGEAAEVMVAAFDLILGPMSEKRRCGESAVLLQVQQAV